MSYPEHLIEYWKEKGITPPVEKVVCAAKSFTFAEGDIMSGLPLPKTLTEAACIILGFGDFEHAVASCDTADEFSTKYHHTVGRTIRNEFGLWKGAGGCPVDEAPLYYWFHRLGLRHPDDMSTIVLELAWCDHNQTSLDLDAEVAKYKAYWEEYWKNEWNSINRAVERVLEKY